MDFDFDPSVADMPQHQQQTVVSMQHLLNNPSPNQPAAMQWTASTQPSELPSIHPAHDSRQSHHHHHHQPLHHRLLQHDDLKAAQSYHHPPQPMHPADIHPDPRQSHPQPSDIKPLMSQAPSGFHLDDNPPIEKHIVMQMGGLPYADLCKEKARERFKEMKKNEHMAKGDFDRMKRRKKGDTSMTPREKYVRRLKMNQDSAAAARHAQEVYVHVLEKLVKTTEEEKKALMAENDMLRQQNAALGDKVQRVEAASEKVPAVDPQSLLEQPELYIKKYDATQLAKMLDLLTTPEPVSAQANDPDFAAGKMGIQPAPAV